MSLDWNIGECEDYMELKSDEEWPRTEALIWATMSIGIDHVSENNVDEVYERIRILEMATNQTLVIYPRNRDEPYHEHRARCRFKKAWVRRRIGLYTNASRMTQAQFRKHLYERLQRCAADCHRADEHRLEELAKEQETC